MYKMHYINTAAMPFILKVPGSWGTGDFISIGRQVKDQRTPSEFELIYLFFFIFCLFYIQIKDKWCGVDELPVC